MSDDPSAQEGGHASDVAFSSAVKAMQERLGSRAAYARMEQTKGWPSRVTPELAAFIAERDSFYLATASAEGQPSIQHRDGPKGFLKVLDEETLAFADYRGNRQYSSLGNLSENDKASILLMDYANRRRVKLWGRARSVEDDPGLIARLTETGGTGKPERAIVFEIAAWDVNCPQHITRRYGEADIETAFAKLQGRIDELEAEVARLRGLAAGDG